MELDELKAAWRAVDSRIEAGHALNARIFRELKLERTRSALRPLWWLLGTELAILPLWTPLAIVVAQGIFGFDLYRWFGAGWVAANVVFGIACTPLMVWLARRLDAGRDGIVGGLLDDFAGRRMADAMGRLDEVAAFESEL